MAEHENATKKANEKAEQKHRVRHQDSQPLFDQSHAWDQVLLSLAETPFYPRMDEHAAILSRIPFAAQRGEFITQLQQTYGNRYVQRLVESMKVQAKLNVSAPNDVYEQEADIIAKKVTRAANTQVQRQAEEEEEEEETEEEEEIQTKPALQVQRQEEEEEELQMQAAEEELQTQPAGSQPATVPENLESRIKAARGSGHPLLDVVQKPMGQAFGADFSNVRVHTNSEANMLNQQLNANAFTTGQDIFFRENEYRPGSDSGRELIAHELTHVVQQTGENKLQRKVPEWAIKEYKEESKKTVICSMTPDGKIGSVYFSDKKAGKYRIRMTHKSGPETTVKKGKKRITVQFNIDHDKATSAFNRVGHKWMLPKAVAKLKGKEYMEGYKQWIRDCLKASTADKTPEWATKVEGPETAYKGKPPEGTKLLEMFKRINGRKENWHPSRGAAVKFETDKQTISVLHAAINHIDRICPVKGKRPTKKEAKKRNIEFYQFVEARLPKFVGYMRSPAEI